MGCNICGGREDQYCENCDPEIGNNDEVFCPYAALRNRIYALQADPEIISILDSMLDIIQGVK